MRIAFLPDGNTVNAFYRSIAPMAALASRGHQTRRLELDDMRNWGDLLRWCDLLHVHRVCDGGAVDLAWAAKEAGAAVVWDDDDDVTQIDQRVAPASAPVGEQAVRRLAARGRLFEAVDLVTTPSAHLAEVFRAGGARDTQLLENYVVDGRLKEHVPCDGLTIGWVAALEHRLDLEHLPIVEVLGTLLDEHASLRVTTIGVDLELRSERYCCLGIVPFPRLLHHVGSFSIGIAPLSPDVTLNHARSNIKLKEYATVGVPWLASPIGPYVGLGERQGGRLVPDDRWHDQLDRLVRRARDRRRLAKRSMRWGGEQTLSRNVGRWEQAFRDVVERLPRPA